MGSLVLTSCRLAVADLAEAHVYRFHGAVGVLLVGWLTRNGLADVSSVPDPGLQTDVPGVAVHAKLIVFEDMDVFPLYCDVLLLIDGATPDILRFEPILELGLEDLLLFRRLLNRLVS